MLPRIARSREAEEAHMRVCKIIPAFLIVALWFADTADARVRIHIDLSTQTMHVQSSRGNYAWPVSTARPGYVTPRGYYAAQSIQRMHYSRKYEMSPMPHSIFFRGGYAIHGSYATGSLGSPASHGCIRLAPENAALLYELVQAEGASIAITGSPPRASLHASSRHYRGARSTETPEQELFSNPFAPLFGD
jgi:lipoprotein-anchoring transpeptidase ErfK/SrfK